MSRTLRGRARALVLAALALVTTASLVVLPFASAEPPPAAQEKGGKGPQGKEEEDGGNILFHVSDRKQKYSVLYTHEKHLGAGIKCDECHTKIFEKKIGANKFRMKDVTEGKFCGACHTDKPAPEIKHAAFPPKKNCQRCHNVRVHEDYK